MEEKKFEITPVLNGDTGKYEIFKFDEVVNACAIFIKEYGYQDLVINNENDLSLIKSGRTEMRRKLETITNARLDINRLLLGTFNQQLKTIESMLNEADKKSKDKINAYKEENNLSVSKPKIKTLIVKTTDDKVLEKVKAYAIKQGCSAEIK